MGHAQLRALAGSEGQKLSVLEVKGAGEQKQGLVCCESGTQSSPRDDGSAGKSPNGAPSKWGFPCAFEKIENNRLLTPTSIRDARQEALRSVLQKYKFNTPDEHETVKIIYRHLKISPFNNGP